jgi:MoxR-like ATPase
MNSNADTKENGAFLGSDTIRGVREGITRLIDNIKTVVYIHNNKLEYIIASIVAGGHVILADTHGVGKTSLARALAGSLEWQSEDLLIGDIEVEQFSRIQCTVDLLPQDILGYNRFVGSSNKIVFNKGPIFAHFVLCDEINLLTPKAQGSFLQAMQEQAVTIEGKTYRLPDPFFIIATMNLKGAHLFPLPAPQLDRFMIQISLGYPDSQNEAEIIRKHSRDDAWQGFESVVSSRELYRWQRLVDGITIHEDVIDYIVALVRQTRYNPNVHTGASPRTGVKLSRLARALSLVRGENYVSIDTVKEIFFTAVSHRLILKDPSQNADSILEEILRSVPVEIPSKASKASKAKRRQKV